MATKKHQSNKSAKSSPVRLSTYKVESSASKLVQALINPTKKEADPLEEAPIPLKTLAAIVELSSTLPPLINAYVTNIASRGYKFDSVINLDAEDTVDNVYDAMFAEQLTKAVDRGDELDSVKPPEDDDVLKKVESLRNRARLELAQVKAFFSSCVPGSNFTTLCEKMVRDKEAIGNSYCEVLRGEDNKPRNLVHLKAQEIRIGKSIPDDSGATVRTIRRTTDISWEKPKVRRQFKRFAKIDDKGAPQIWFKQFGDPRVMSRSTGVYFTDVKTLIAKEGKDAKAATEILHDSIYSSTSEYGVPRWSGNTPAVLGSRELDETNLDYFNSNAVPALALLVSGGMLAKGSDEKLKEFFEQEVRGRRSTHKLVVLEALSQRVSGATAPNPNPKLEFVPLRNAQVKDALFLNYDNSNILKIHSSFRLPLSITGKDKITVEDLRFAEEQVYVPNRDDFNSLINDNILPALSIMFWKFALKATPIRDPQVAGELVLKAAEVGVLIPTEARKILSDILSVDIPVIRALWAANPIPFTTAILGIKAGPAEAVREQGRQAGNTPPIDRLVGELGLGPEAGASDDDDDAEGGSNLPPLPSSGGKDDDEDEEEKEDGKKK